MKYDIAMVRAHRGDTWGNLIYRGTSRNFNVPAATCADFVIAEVENLYTMGEIDPEGIHTSGIFVDAVVRANIEYCTMREENLQCLMRSRSSPPAPAESSGTGRSSTSVSACPTMIANYVPEGVDVVIQTENGAIGVGPAPEPGCEDRDRANAGNQPISLIPGGSYFDSATSFAMIRGGHVDATFLGTLQVDEKGNIANWIVPGKMLAGMGGAMDLITGAKIVYIVTEHCSKDGASKLMKECTFPLTGAEEADVIITERALLRSFPEHGWVLEEVACGYSLDDIAACTDMAYAVADDVKLEAYGADES